MDRVRVAAAVLVAVLAGCTLPGGQPTETVTPVDIGDDSPPGVSIRTDSIDIDRLLDAHERVLANQSYTLQVDRIERASGQKVGRLSIAGEFGADSEAYLLDIRARGRPSAYRWGQRSTYWAGGNRSVVARQYANTTWYHFVEPSRATLPIEATRRSRIAGALSETTVTTIESTPDGVTIEARADRAGGGLTNLWSGTTIRSASVVIDVATSGLIRSYEIEYTIVEDEGDRTRIHETATIDGVGSTTVPRPEWVNRTLASGRYPPPTINRERPGY
ncbi:MAG: hypothetical protein ABEJ86_07160 [Halococcoides sp.]